MRYIRYEENGEAVSYYGFLIKENDGLMHVVDPLCGQLLIKHGKDRWLEEDGIPVRVMFQTSYTFFPEPTWLSANDWILDFPLLDGDKKEFAAICNFFEQYNNLVPLPFTKRLEEAMKRSAIRERATMKRLVRFVLDKQQPQSERLRSALSSPIASALNA